MEGAENVLRPGGTQDNSARERALHQTAQRVNVCERQSLKKSRDLSSWLMADYHFGSDPAPVTANLG